MKILMINVPFSGHTNPTLLLAETLVQKGHEVFYINAEEFRTKIESTGANFIPYIHYPENPTTQQRKAMCFRAAFDTAMQLDLRFDLLLYEMFFFPGIKIAQNLGIPCVRQFSQPAWNQEKLVTATVFFKLSCRIINALVMGKKNAEYMQLEHKTLADAVINDLPDLNIVYVPQVFQDKRDTFGEDYLFTVPIASGIGVGNKEIPYQDMKHPIVYISLGSIISNKGFCRECIRAFGNKPVSVILNTGKVSPESLGRIPENIHAYSFVPQLEVLQHADVFLTHCGMNSVNEAIYYGVPMVAMPFINDQITNADRIIELGIGKRVRSFPSRGKELYNAVLEVADQGIYKEKVKRLQSLVKNEMTMDEIVKNVEKIVNTKCPDKEI